MASRSATVLVPRQQEEDCHLGPRPVEQQHRGGKQQRSHSGSISSQFISGEPSAGEEAFSQPGPVLDPVWADQDRHCSQVVRNVAFAASSVPVVPLVAVITLAMDFTQSHCEFLD